MSSLMAVDENGELQEVTITGFPLWPERNISKFRRAVVNGEVIAGEDILDVFPPEPGSIVWRIVLKNGQLYRATGNILLVNE